VAGRPVVRHSMSRSCGVDYVNVGGDELVMSCRKRTQRVGFLEDGYWKWWAWWEMEPKHSRRSRLLTSLRCREARTCDRAKVMEERDLLSLFTCLDQNMFFCQWGDAQPWGHRSSRVNCEMLMGQEKPVWGARVSTNDRLGRI
jgi:hypothetical protein